MCIRIKIQGYPDLDSRAHTWWSRPLVLAFWINLFNIPMNLIECPIQTHPNLAPPNKHHTNNTPIQIKLLLQVFTVAKQTIARDWKKQNLCFAESKNRLT